MKRTLDEMEVHAETAAVRSAISNLPHYTRYSRTFAAELAPDDPVHVHLVANFQRTSVQHRGPPGPEKSVIRAAPMFDVVRVEQLHNPRAQEAYLAELQDLWGLCKHGVTPLRERDPTVEQMKLLEVQTGELNLNEFMLYHGAPSELYERLFYQGLDPRYAGCNAGKMYGLGTYLATHSSKADCYTRANAAGEHLVFVVRALLGEPHLERLETAERKAEVKQWRLPPERTDKRGPLSSVVGVTREHGGWCVWPEYIVYERRQCLCQFAIWYRHAADCFCTHCVQHKVLVEDTRSGVSFAVEAAYAASAEVVTLESSVGDIQQRIAEKVAVAPERQELMYEDGAPVDPQLPLQCIGWGCKLKLRVRAMARPEFELL